MKRSRIRRVNRVRKARLHERNFGAYADLIRAMRCVGCGRPPPSDPAHTVARGMGGCGGDKSTLVPLCATDVRSGWVGCHALFDTDGAAFKERTWLSRDDVRAIAAELWRTYGDRAAD